MSSFSSLVDFNFKGNCYRSSNVPNSFILFDFKEHLISVSAYSIKSSNQSIPDFLQTWVLEGSNDKISWICLDSHENDRSLDSKLKIGVFHIQDRLKKSQFFKFIQLRMTGKSIRGSNFLEILNIEFFGQYA